MLAEIYGNTVVERTALNRQRDAWNRAAPLWKRWDLFLAACLEPVGDAMLAAARLTTGHMVLDAGCGTGDLGLAAAGKVAGGSVVGVDFAEEMVQTAQEKGTARGFKNYKAVVAEASAMPFDDNSFDVVLARHAVAIFRTAKPLARVLKPRGRLVLSSWGPLERNPWMVVAKEAIRTATDWPLRLEDVTGPFHCSDPKTITPLFKAADVYDKYELSELSGEVVFDSPDHYWRFLTEIVVMATPALEERWGEHRERVRRAVLTAAKTHVRDGRLAFGWSAWVASAAKPRRRAPQPIRLHVEYEDQHGRVWHEHESIYPEPKGSKSAPETPVKIPRGYRLGFG